MEHCEETNAVLGKKLQKKKSKRFREEELIDSGRMSRRGEIEEELIDSGRMSRRGEIEEELIDSGRMSRRGEIEKELIDSGRMSRRGEIEEELIDSGRMSRRGEIDENIVKYGDESEQSETSQKEDGVDPGDRDQITPSAWKKVKTKTVAVSAVLSNGSDIPDNRDSNGHASDALTRTRICQDVERDSQDMKSNCFNSRHNTIDQVSRYSIPEQELEGKEEDGLEQEKWAETHVLNETEEPGYRSIPGSRQGNSEETNQNPNENSRSCKSADVISSSKDGRRQSSFHKSQSSPMLTENKGSMEERNRTKLFTDIQNKQKLQETSEESTAYEDVNQIGLQERFPGRASKRLSEVATAVSVSNQFKASSNDICTDLTKISHKIEKSLQTRTGSKDSLLRKCKRDSAGSEKSVTWSDRHENRPPEIEQDCPPNDNNSIATRNGSLYTCAYEQKTEPSSIEGTGGQLSHHFEDNQGQRSSVEETGSRDNTEASDQTSPDSPIGESCPSIPENVLKEWVGYFEKLRANFKSEQMDEARLNTYCTDLQALEECLEAYRPLSERIVHTLSMTKERLKECMKGILDLQCETSPELLEDSADTLNHLDNTFQGIIEDCLASFKDQIRLVTETDKFPRTGKEVPETDITSQEVKKSFVAPIEECSQIEAGAKIDGQESVVQFTEKKENKEPKRASKTKPEKSANKNYEKSSDNSDSEGEEDSLSESSEDSYFSEWPRFVCPVQQEPEEDRLNCIVHADPDVVSFSQISCEVVEASKFRPVVREWETLAEKIVRLSAEDLDQKSSTKCFLLALPYRKSLVENWQDVLVMQLSDNGDWKQMPPTKHKAILEEEKCDRDETEGGGSCYAQVETDRLGTFAVVARSKVERIKFAAAGGLMQSSVDHRISVRIAENTCYGNCEMALQVCYPDPCSIYDFRLIKEDNSSFKASTPIIDIEFTEDITNAVHLSVPMIVPQKRLLRASSRFSSGTTRQAPVPDPFDPKELLLFQKTSTCEWKLVRYAKVYNTVSFQGNVTFEWFEKKGRLAVVNIAKDIPRKTIGPKASVFLTYLTLKPVEITIDQDPSCNYSVSVTVGPKQFGAKRRRLRRDETQHIFSKDAMLREGQPVDVNLRGNLLPNYIFPRRFIFYAVETNSFRFHVTINDRFTQRSLPYYCGFVQLIDPLHLMAEPRLETKGKVPAAILEKPMVLTEICVKIAKPPPQPLQPLVRAHLNIGLNGGVSFEVLREVALQFADEWKKLARSLHVPHARVQSIVRNTKGKQPEHIALEVLLSWAKRVPISQDKASLLCEGLARCGRPDLVIGIREKDRQKKQNDIHLATSYNLKKAILIVSRSPTVLFQWRTLVLVLGLSKSDVQDIECLPLNDQEICHLALERWQAAFQSTATVKVLAKQLMLMGCFHVSELISTAYGNV